MRRFLKTWRNIKAQPENLNYFYRIFLLCYCQKLSWSFDFHSLIALCIKSTLDKKELRRSNQKTSRKVLIIISSSYRFSSTHTFIFTIYIRTSRLTNLRSFSMFQKKEQQETCGCSKSPPYKQLLVLLTTTDTSNHKSQNQTLKWVYLEFHGTNRMFSWRCSSVENFLTSTL